jgi:hypothetical protein
MKFFNPSTIDLTIEKSKNACSKSNPPSKENTSVLEKIYGGILRTGIGFFAARNASSFALFHLTNP